MITFTKGLPYSYGIFEKYYSSHAAFSSEKGIAAIGTTCMVSCALRHFAVYIQLLLVSYLPYAEVSSTFRDSHILEAQLRLLCCNGGPRIEERYPSLGW